MTIAKNLKAHLNECNQDMIFVWSWRISLGLLLLIVVFLLVFWGKLPPVIPFYYSLPWGEEQLAPPVVLWILWGSSIIFSSITFLVGVLLNKSYSYYARILWAATPSILLLSFITISKIILLIQ